MSTDYSTTEALVFAIRSALIDVLFPMTIRGFLRSALATVWRRRRDTEPAPSLVSEQRAMQAVDTVFTPTTASPSVPIAASAAAGHDTTSEAVADFVASVRHLPLFTGTALQLIRSVGQEDVTSAELTRLISTDAGLVAHLLRIANSPYYGLAQRLGTVGEALAVLGFNQVRRTVTAAVLQRPLMTYLHDTAVVRAFWRHELTCAALARHLTMRNGGDGELAYMAGLMHDVGRLAMLMQFPQHADVLLRADGDALGFEREHAAFGFDHAQVGGALLERWGLPPTIVLAASRHTDLSPPVDAIGASVWEANLLTHEAEAVALDGDERPAWMIDIGLDLDALRRIRAEIAVLESDSA